MKEERGLSGWEVPRPVGHPIPAYSEPAGSQRSEGRSIFVNGRAALIGDAGHLVDPLFGEGIYYAVRSGQMVARAILADTQVCAESLLAYEAALEREILPDFRVTGRIASVVYAFPRLAFTLLRRYQEVVQAYFRVLQGHTTAAQFLPDAKQRLKASVNDLLLQALQMR